MIQSSELTSFNHGFFTREGGNSRGLYASLNCGYGSGDDKSLVASNRALVADRLGVTPERLLTAWQWHSSDALIVDRPWNPAHPPKADAIATNVPGLALGVLTADCAPVLFADARARVVAAAHAGWQGALNGITDVAIAAMEKLGARRQDIIAVIGPTISARAYEVGPEFHTRFIEQHASHERFFSPSGRPNHFMFDLPAYVAHRLRQAGLGSVSELGQCTYADEERFFSFRRTTHRREESYGRQISAIALPA